MSVASAGVRRALAISVVSALFATSCGSGNPAAPSADGLTNVVWRLQSIQRIGLPRIETPNPDRYTVTFGDDGRVNVRADCNTCTGTYERTGPRLRLGPLACTRAFCGNDSLDAEYLRVLDGASSLSLVSAVLTIEGAGTVLTFRP